MPLVQQRCLNHANREAVARCPVCRHYFCRECISEYEDRVLCTSCLRKLQSPKKTRRAGFTGILRAVPFLLAIGVTWFFFFLVGKGLLAIPSSFHQKTLWKALEMKMQ